MNEPPVWYYVMGAPADKAWRSARLWPLPEQVLTKFHLVEDGQLSSAESGDKNSWDSYTVDYSTTTGSGSRWHNTVGTPFMYDDMAPLANKSLTYTTAALDQAVEVTGHPVVHLWITANVPDVDLFIYLEEVSPSGRATYITEGMLRASHRAQHEPPYHYMKLPWHRSFKEDVQPLPKDEPVELAFDLLPTSNIFNAGNHIRIRVVGADKDNFQTPQIVPSPTVSIFHHSYIELPVIPTKNP